MASCIAYLLMILAIVMCTGEASAVFGCSSLLMQTKPVSLQDSIMGNIVAALL
jgi:hypothetical protein